MALLSNLRITCALLVVFLIPGTLNAAFVDSKRDDNVVYFLFAGPNKIVRYDLTAQNFLEDISLDKIPTAFDVSNGMAYIGFHTALERIEVSTANIAPIAITSTDITNITTVGNFLYAAEQNADVTAINLTNLGVVEVRNSFYSGTAFVGSSIQSAYYYRTIGVSPSDIHKVSLNPDGTTISDMDTIYHGDFPNANKLYINTAEDKVFDNEGIIYFTSEFTYAGSLGGPLDALAFVNNQPVALRGNQLILYNESQVELGEFILDHTPTLISANDQTVFTFSINETASSIDVATVSVSSFALPVPATPPDPSVLAYQPEFYELDSTSNILYIVDQETLSVFRWSTDSSTYLNSWGLIAAPTWVTLSSSHNRLYLGYPNGRITYFDLTAPNAVEHHFANLASSTHGLLAAGNYLYAADSRNRLSHYSFDVNGVLIDHADLWAIGSQYVWNPLTSRVYNYYDYSAPNDIYYTEINQTTGLFGANSDSPYHGDTLITAYPIRVSNDGQFILNGAGQIIDAYDLTVLNSLPNYITDAAWVNSNLVTIKFGDPELQIWDANFAPTLSHSLATSIAARVFNLNGLLLLVEEKADGPIFTLYDLQNLPDSDSDGIHDLQDNCLDIANQDQADFDGDNLGDVCDPDDDNDDIPDNIESGYGLNPLDASDASGDLDNDGYNNWLEYILGSNLNDATSTPTRLSNYSDDFENGLPAGFYTTPGIPGWTIRNVSGTENSALASTFFNTTNGQSEINFVAVFEAGVLWFEYTSIGPNRYQYDLEVLLDGNVVGNGYSPFDELTWNSLAVQVPAGVHTITLRVTTNYTFGDERESYYMIDNISFGADTDGDGVPDLTDNCPNVWNRYQEDYNGNGIGDACEAVSEIPGNNSPSSQFGGGGSFSWFLIVLLAFATYRHVCTLNQCRTSMKKENPNYNVLKVNC